jgi:hypothetical protein
VGQNGKETENQSKAMEQWWWTAKDVVLRETHAIANES